MPAMCAAPAPDAPLILVVDDERDIREMLAGALGEFGYRVVTAASAEEALATAAARSPALVLTDVHMGGRTGVELCRTLKQDPRFELTPVLILTALSDLDARVAGLAAGADDFFGKPVELVELRTRVAALLRVKELLDQLERAGEVLKALGLTIEARDPYTAGHCDRLAWYAEAVGRRRGADRRLLRALRLGGYLHDLGKIGVPDAVLLKRGRLDPGEREVIERHPVIGERLVQGLRTLDDVRPLIRHHHERFDGSGYPDGLEGDRIPLGARIMAVVDVYDALTTERPYKPALPREEALAIMRRETAAGAWDPDVLAALEAVLDEGGPAAPDAPPGQSPAAPRT